MSDKTLYLIQSVFHTADQQLSALTHILIENDSVVLMGDAVLHHQHSTLQNFMNVYALTSDLEILGKISHDLIAIDYAQFADLCLKFTRCVSLK
jgi:sulfur relay protein TusB/DsrH